MRNPKDKDEVLESCNFFYNKDEGFLNDFPLHLEIGMGKGQFLLNMALKFPHINFLGVEKYTSVMVQAIKKIRRYDLPNLKVLIADAKNLPDVIFHKVSCIYLNFSDPWPKDRHAKRRLTATPFLEIYDQLFQGKCQIIQKTDDDNLFAFSLDSLQNYGYTIDYVTYDLHKTNKENILTEYEEKFSFKPIKYLEAHKD